MRLFLFSFFILLVSCSESKHEKHFLERKLSVKEKMKRILSPEESALNGITEDERLFLDSIYSEHKYRPFWIKDSIYLPEGERVLKTFSFPEQVGLPKKRYQSLHLQDTMLRNELKLSLFLAHSIADLNRGYLDSVLTQFADKQLISPSHFKAYHKQIKEKIALDSIYYRIIPHDTNYRKMWISLNTFSKTEKIDKIEYDIPSQKKDSVAAWEIAAKALRNKGYLFSSEPDSIMNALKQFQHDTKQKVDGVIGESTTEILGESTYAKLLRTCLSLEKIRAQAKFPKTFVWINIPSFSLYYVFDDTLRSTNRVVVGTFKNQTPTLRSSIHTLVALPYWNVPYSIASKEVLPAVQRNIGYLYRNNMKVFQKKVEVDPSGIDWKKYSDKNFPFQIRQEPGPNNSLGIIKFEFHNKYSVYVHDSPSKSLFGTIHRSYSHGCIRCENPIELGKMMLEFDENSVTVDSLDSIYARNIHTLIPLKKRIPIYVVYLTVQVNDRNELVFLRDFYGKEKEILANWIH